MTQSQTIPIGTAKPKPTTLVMFQDGDPAGTSTGATILTSFADAFAWVLDQVGGIITSAMEFTQAVTFDQNITIATTSGVPVALSSTTLVRGLGTPYIQHLDGVDLVAGTYNGWTFDYAFGTPGGGWGTQWGAGTGFPTTRPLALFLPIGCPNNQTLTQVSVSVAGIGDSSNVPTNPLTLKVFKRALTNTGTFTLLGAQIDTAIGTYGAYSAQHSITVSGLTESIDHSANEYFAVLHAGYGTHGTPGDTYFGGTYTATCTGIPRIP